MCRVGSDTFEGVATNLSDGGLFLETAWLFAPSQEIRMAIDVPGRGTIAATGRPIRFVAGTSRRVGVGVQFLEDGAE